MINDSLSSCLTKKIDTHDIISKNISENTIEHLNINKTLKLDSAPTIKASNLKEDIFVLLSDDGRENS